VKTTQPQYDSKRFQVKSETLRAFGKEMRQLKKDTLKKQADPE